ncbi:MAG TPA: zinc ribbon domain-containing protein [Firmicutes bacterium]|nr:zinc ribbon domain-containing protein [Candidatus Fermentithermobacillaceae bacterium]
MPIFEYRCQECGKKFEVYLRGKEVPKCPDCGSDSLKKLISSFNSNVSGGKGASCGGCGGGNCSSCGK